jgi:hypothetical protein
MDWAWHKLEIQTKCKSENLKRRDNYRDLDGRETLNRS